MDNHDGPAIDMVLADEQVYNELLWTLTDNQGSVRDLVDNAGTVESHIDYSSFGKVDLITDDLAQTLYGFTGRERDAETGLNYHRARYYDPVVGRWLSEDPISFGGGDTNLYRYVFNNSVLYTDPTGMFAQDLEGLINQFAEMGKKLMNGAANMPEEVKSALLDLTQLGLDVGGIFEPTPFCDITSGIMSGFRGDWWGAGTSAASMIPYLGDLAKIGKLGKYAKMVTNMAEILGKHMDVGKILGPMFKSLDEVLGKGMEMLGDMAPKLAEAVADLKCAVSQAINKLGFDFAECFVAGTGVVMAGPGMEVAADFAAPDAPVLRRTDSTAVGVVVVGVAGYAIVKERRPRGRRRKQAADGFVDGVSSGDSTDEESSTTAAEPAHDATVGDDMQPSESLATPDADAAAILAAWSAARPPRESWWRRHRAALGIGWLAACLLIAGLLFTRGGRDAPAIESVARAAALPADALSADAVAPARTKPIEQIRVGDRVAVEDAPTDEDLSFGDDVDPATWRRVLLRAPKDDGGWSDVTLLRPAAWLNANDVHRGATIDLFILECGIDAPAEVLSVGPCPQIAPRDGRIVTGTFRHHSRNIVDVFVSGLSEPIGTTVNHPFWSEDRQSFVSAGDLQSGERLLGLDGPSVVTAVVPRTEGAAVYNLEVQVDHVYHVGSAGLLVHNACLGSTVRGIRSAGKFDDVVGSLDEAIEAVRKAFPDAIQLPPAIPGRPYPSPPAGVKKWFQVHPAEPGVGNNLPHIKYVDWTRGKKGTGGSWGHIFFPQ